MILTFVSSLSVS